MTIQRQIGLSTLVVIASIGPLAFANGQGESAQPIETKPVTKIPDPFVGRYNWQGFWLEKGKAQIVKEGEFYRLKLTDNSGRIISSYESYKFVKKSETCLVDEKGILGNISLGHLKFEGEKDQIVLRADFCYTHGNLLFKTSD